RLTPRSIMRGDTPISPKLSHAKSPIARSLLSGAPVCPSTCLTRGRPCGASPADCGRCAPQPRYARAASPPPHPPHSTHALPTLQGARGRALGWDPPRPHSSSFLLLAGGSQDRPAFPARSDKDQVRRSITASMGVLATPVLEVHVDQVIKPRLEPPRCAER